MLTLEEIFETIKFRRQFEGDTGYREDWRTSKKVGVSVKYSPQRESYELTIKPLKKL